jgi:hypothetical protein
MPASLPACLPGRHDLPADVDTQDIDRQTKSGPGEKTKGPTERSGLIANAGIQPGSWFEGAM